MEEVVGKILLFTFGNELLNSFPKTYGFTLLK